MLTKLRSGEHLDLATVVRIATWSPTQYTPVWIVQIDWQADSSRCWPTIALRCDSQAEAQAYANELAEAVNQAVVERGGKGWSPAAKPELMKSWRQEPSFLGGMS